MQPIIAERTHIVPWWHEAAHDACMLEFGTDTGRFEAATAFESREVDDESTDTICLRYYPNTLALVSLPEVVRLIVPTEEGTATYQLRVVSSEGTLLRVSSTPITVDQRRLRRTPRTPYHLGPCAAVVHGVNGQWRGVIEFWIWDVSEAGVGFKAELGRAFLLSVGDNIRVPITLPDGRRSWLDGHVAWLTPDGRGGMVARKAPRWLPEPDVVL